MALVAKIKNDLGTPVVCNIVQSVILANDAMLITFAYAQPIDVATIDPNKDLEVQAQAVFHVAVPASVFGEWVSNLVKVVGALNEDVRARFSWNALTSAIESNPKNKK